MKSVAIVTNHRTSSLGPFLRKNLEMVLSVFVTGGECRLRRTNIHWYRDGLRVGHVRQKKAGACRGELSLARRRPSACIVPCRWMILHTTGGGHEAQLREGATIRTTGHSLRAAEPIILGMPLVNDGYAVPATRQPMIRAFLLGILASLFFAVTFVLNRQMGVVGGHWIWTASMRFFYMLPMLFVLVLPGGRYRRVIAEIRKNAVGWLLWSTVGFGVFYLFICLASTYGPSWLIAAAWQMTIIAGALLTPLLYGRSGAAAGCQPDNW